MLEFNLICPLLVDDPLYAYGVEFGMLFEQMKVEDRIQGLYLTANQEQILLLASRAGWHVRRCGSDHDGWFWLDMRKCETAL